MSTAPKPNLPNKLTAQQYLEIERASETRSEFFDGEMFAMAGATKEHARITLNIARRIDEQFDGRACEVYSTDLRVKIAATGLYTYPDVVATCEKPQFEDSVLDTLLNPQVIFEVLSPSTEDYDRTTKFEHYKTIPSLNEYWLVSQSRMLIERFVRNEENEWLYQIYYRQRDSIGLARIRCEIEMKQIYARVEVPEGLPRIVRELSSGFECRRPEFVAP